jgi:Skp family chaperone for outer membrane proteins
MKFFRLPVLSLLVAAVTAPLAAQPKTTPVIKTVEVARVAYVNSNLFLDETTGIKQLVRVAQSLQTEFTSTESELSLLNEKIRTIAGEINRLQGDPKANAKALEDDQAAGLRLQQELQTKQQAAQAAFAKRQQELQGPVVAEISKSIRAFAKARDIGIPHKKHLAALRPAPRHRHPVRHGQARRGRHRRQARP